MMPDRSEHTGESDRTPHRHAPGSYGEILSVAVPLMLTYGSLSLMSIVDRIMLTGYSAESLAAITPASMLHWTVICIPLGVVQYSNTFIAQHEGARRIAGMTASFWQAVWLAVLLGGALTLMAPAALPIFRWAGHRPVLAAAEAHYFRPLCIGSPVILLAGALSCFFSGRRKTRTVLLVNLLGVALNAVADYVLIYGRGIIPEFGISGAAWATVLARGCDCIVYAVLIVRSQKRLRLPHARCFRPSISILKRYARYGLPAGLHAFLDTAGFAVFMLIIGRLDQDSLAATNLAFSVNSVIFIPLLGFGTAVQTVVANHIGADDRTAAAVTATRSGYIGIVWTLGMSLLLVAFPDRVLLPFAAFAEGASLSDLQRLIPIVRVLLKFVAVYSVFDSLAVVYASALRGAGDTVFPMIAMLISGWLLMVLPAWMMLHYGAPRITYLWAACTAHITASGLVMYLRFRTGRWKQIDITH